MAAAAGLTGRLTGGLRGRIGRGRARLSGPGREPGIDLARGLAVIGMLAAHLLDITPFDWTHPATWADAVNGRSSILFATLAGVSLALLTGGPRPFEGDRMARARAALALRAACIWLLGVLLVALQTPVLVILPAYGILFLLASPLLRLPVPALFGTACAIAVIAPFAVFAVDAWPVWDGDVGQTLAHALGWHYPFVLWLAFVLAGVGMGRMRFARPGTAALLLGVGAVLAGVGYGVVGRWGELSPADSVWGVVLSSGAHSSGIGEAIGSGGVAMAVIALCALLCRTPARGALLPLRAVGTMPLTAYTGQLLAWAALQPPAGAHGSELAAFRALEPFWPLTIATIAGCTTWALLFGRGPLERLVGRISRLRPSEAAAGGAPSERTPADR